MPQISGFVTVAVSSRCWALCLCDPNPAQIVSFLGLVGLGVWGLMRVKGLGFKVYGPNQPRPSACLTSALGNEALVQLTRQTTRRRV